MFHVKQKDFSLLNQTSRSYSFLFRRNVQNFYGYQRENPRPKPASAQPSIPHQDSTEGSSPRSDADFTTGAGS
jgi:hypothetical protein